MFMWSQWNESIKVFWKEYWRLFDAKDFDAAKALEKQIVLATRVMKGKFK